MNVTFTSPTLCNDGWVTDSFWKTNIEIFCDPNGKLNHELLSSDFTVVEDKKLCQLKISARHKAGCPVVEATAFINWLAKNPAIAGIVLIAFGFLATFFGGRFFHAIISVAGGFLTFFVVILILSVFGGLKAMDSDVASGNIGWILVAVLCFAVATTAGLGIAFLTNKYKRFGSALFGLFIGLLIGYYVHKLLFTKIFSGAVLKYIVVGAFTLGVGVYSFTWSKTLTVPMTAVFGAFWMIRGFSMFLGGFPNEFQSDEDGKMFEVKNSYIYYLFAYLILLCAGVAHQRHRKYHTLYDDDQFSKLNPSINGAGDGDYFRMHMMN